MNEQPDMCLIPGLEKKMIEFIHFVSRLFKAYQLCLNLCAAHQGVEIDECFAIALHCIVKTH